VGVAATDVARSALKQSTKKDSLNEAQFFHVGSYSHAQARFLAYVTDRRVSMFGKPTPPQPPKPPATREQVFRMLSNTLRAMTTFAEACRQLVEQLNKRVRTRPLRLALIFDTSFLMLDKLPEHFLGFWEVIRHRILDVRVILPPDVCNELHKHLSTDKSEPARVGRKRLAEMIESGVDIEEPSFSEVVEFTSHSKLGADSPVDRKLIGYARSLALSNEVCGVVIATDDGGIMLDVARLNRDGIHVTTLSKEKTDIDYWVWRFLASTSDEFLNVIAGA
jgi:hypothetical protein